MSDTTHEAPERIWLQLGAGDEGTHTWADHQVGWDDEGEYEPEYVRADLVQAAVAAALRKAADAVREALRPSAGRAARATILALITPDEQAALDRVKAERERCAKIAWSHVDDETSGDPDFDAGWEAAACAITDAIRKGGE